LVNRLTNIQKKVDNKYLVTAKFNKIALYVVLADLKKDEFLFSNKLSFKQKKKQFVLIFFMVELLKNSFVPIQTHPVWSRL
jgi:hypothetical protein